MGTISQLWQGTSCLQNNVPISVAGFSGGTDSNEATEQQQIVADKCGWVTSLGAAGGVRKRGRAPLDRKHKALLLQLYWDPVVRGSAIGDDQWAGLFFQMWNDCGDIVEVACSQ